jgi:hypothetical protein
MTALLATPASPAPAAAPARAGLRPLGRLGAAALVVGAALTPARPSSPAR